MTSYNFMAVFIYEKFPFQFTLTKKIIYSKASPVYFKLNRLYMLFIMSVQCVKLYKHNTQGFTQYDCVSFIFCLNCSEYLYKSYSYVLYL